PRRTPDWKSGGGNPGARFQRRGLEGALRAPGGVSYVDPSLRRGGVLLSGDRRGAGLPPGNGQIPHRSSAGAAPRRAPESHGDGRRGTGSGHMSCTPFETLSAYADSALTEYELATVADHVQSCPSCRSRLDDLRWLKDAVRSAAAPAIATEEFRARLAA